MRVFDSGAGGRERAASDRVVTVPNALSLARLLVLPWLYVELTSGRLGAALVLLVAFAGTDWLDGHLARRLDQVTRLGALLDPISDRVFVVVLAVGFVVSGITPLWTVVLVLARDVVVSGSGLLLLARGERPAPTSRTGKAATFGVMAAFTGWLAAAWLGGGAATPQRALDSASWVVFGLALIGYYVSAYGYARAVAARRS